MFNYPKHIRSNSEKKAEPYEKSYGMQVQEHIRSNIVMNSPQNIRSKAN